MWPNGPVDIELTVVVVKVSSSFCFCSCERVLEKGTSNEVPFS